MEKRKLLPEQAAAAYEIKKHISVTAGPGSGKTTVLVERYLHILREQSLSIDQIVAITFTNRAANEMRERLRKELNAILETTTGDERRRWLNYKRTLDGAVITTIHGFCARLLREFPLEARVDPQFMLLDEHQAALMLEWIVEEVLSEYISAGHVEISRLTLGVGRSRLAAALAQVYRDARGQGLSFEELALATARVHATTDDHAQAIDDLDRAIDELLAVRRTTPAARANQQQLMSGWPEIRKLLQTVPSHETLADYCRRIGDFRDRLRPAARSPIADHVKAIDTLVWEKELQGRIPQVCLDLFARQYALEMVNLLNSIDRRLNEEKHKLSALDFDDLESRTMVLLQRPEVIARTEDRYRFFLVDEFQDTNGVQQRLLERLALPVGRRAANLFIVGDRKQSIYSFRGADVDVFREMTSILTAAGGETKPLQLNFRSQPPLIAFFNHLFARLFQLPEDMPVEFRTSQEGGKRSDAPVRRTFLDELGYVKHEDSEPKRQLRDDGPLVELMVTAKVPIEDDPRAEQDTRVLDAKQLARRINALKSENPDLKYGDIALLFRAMTHVQIYESAFRQANIPYQTVLGRGFYEREEITDLIQLLRFLDNKTDELALAAVLRSPLCGLSDNALLALRTPPTRKFYTALQNHREIEYISDEEHELLDRACRLISRLVARRHHYSIHDLLRLAVQESEYMTVVAANFDGAQRLANIQRLFTLAARFESSGTHLIRDFVRYVEEFEAIGSRESEGQIDQAADAVRLMTIHQAKGLEFPVVIIPDLQRLSRVATDTWVMLDRHQGLTMKVPDGRGNLVAGCTFSTFEKRHAYRELFESMRLLYVAATRAEDRLILSGATDDLPGLNRANDSWLKWIWQALELEGRTQSDVVDLADGVQLQLTINLADEPLPEFEPELEEVLEPGPAGESLGQVFPLRRPVIAIAGSSIHRFSVTQLINYQRCPRQYYFERVLRLPQADELAIWNNAEAPEPPSNINATLKGAVIHRFCERFTPDQDSEELLRQSFAEVLRLRQAQLADRLVEINSEAAITDLLPLAKNYLASDVFKRVESARKVSAVKPTGDAGLWSELSFRLRRPLGILSGIIDKLLITQTAEGWFEAEIIDFKTNRIRVDVPAVVYEAPAKRRSSRSPQFAFDFEPEPEPPPLDVATNNMIEITARDYQLQMQAYAHAVRELIPSLAASRIRVTLHFLDPNVETHLSDELLEPARCARAIDEAMMRIVTSADPAHFPVKTAPHCRMCNFLRVCTAGKEYLR